MQKLNSEPTNFETSCTQKKVLLWNQINMISNVYQEVELNIIEMFFFWLSWFLSPFTASGPHQFVPSVSLQLCTPGNPPTASYK